MGPLILFPGRSAQVENSKAKIDCDAEEAMNSPWKSWAAWCPLGVAVLAFALGSLTGCKEKQNKFVAQPPPRVGVAVPLKKAITPYLELTGNTSPIAKVDLVARVEGYLTAINYVDGALAKSDDVLFEIERAPYVAQVHQSEADLMGARAALVQAEAEFGRQFTLQRDNVSAQATLDIARAKRDSDQASVQAKEASLQTAGINLSYTQVRAPFDGMVTRHLVSKGELVGTTGQMKLASVEQLNPIYVVVNVSEQDVMRFRASHAQHRLTLAEFQQIPLEVGLEGEDDFPHKGAINYVSPELDPQTATILVRGVFENNDLALLPGMYVRVRMPLGPPMPNALLVPDRILQQSQQGRYLLVVGADERVEQRPVQFGQLQGSLRVITAGLKPDDRVIVTALDRAIPGRKVTPQPVSIGNDGSVTAAN
jgi:RND family efflux transporter MFP subunit